MDTGNVLTILKAAITLDVNSCIYKREFKLAQLIGKLERRHNNWSLLVILGWMFQKQAKLMASHCLLRGICDMRTRQP